MTKTNKTEIIAGITTFLTMSYIIVVNPAILSTEGTGMSFSGVLTATVLISFLSTLLMGVFAKLPFALAPGMGINTFFTFTLILGEKIPWPEALGLVFWSGVFFLIISLTNLRQKIVEAIPKHLRLAMSCGIGLFLTFIGLKNAFIITSSPATFVTSAPFSWPLVFSILGLLLTVYFMRRKNPASFLIGIVFISALALIFGQSALPTHYFSLPDFDSTFFKLDIIKAINISYIPIIVTLIITDLFDSVSSFIGVSTSANLLDEKGEPKNLKQALFVDALATFFSSLFGTSAATTFIESSAGTEAGGRTGLTAIVASFCFLPFLFLSPLLSSIPIFATAPILIIVGSLMFKNISKINFQEIELAVPAFLTIVLIPLTFSISQGIMWGFFTHVALFLLFKRARELSPIMFLLGVGAVFYILFNS
tara:strand:- start:1195 stop:2460 length:1266 start_codon:yes stop_codon:yes gene_type:complete